MPIGEVICTTTSARTDRDGATRQVLVARSACADGAQRERWLQVAVELNLGLAAEVVARYRGRGVEDDDLEQIARLGLVKAATHYDPAGEASFRVFAWPTIEGEVKRYFRDRAGLVRLPRRLYELQPAVARAQRQLESDLRRLPTAAEIAAAVGAPVEEVTELLTIGPEVRAESLDRLLDTHDLPPDQDDLVATMERAEDAEVLRCILRRLDRRDRLVLRLRYLDEWTQAAIGRTIGVSQVQVSRIIKRALAEARTVARQVVD